MLATADRYGVCALTVGGLAALGRISREEAEEAFLVLSSPDTDTLTQANEGRRIKRVENGWKLLNWETYREKAKKAVLQECNRESQARWRERNSHKTSGADNSADLNLSGQEEPQPQKKQNPAWSPTLIQSRLGMLFRRRPTTRWSKDELKALAGIGEISEEDLKALEVYYTANMPDASNYRRRDLSTLLNNFNGEVDRARQYKPATCF